MKKNLLLTTLTTALIIGLVGCGNSTSIPAPESSSNSSEITTPNSSENVSSEIPSSESLSSEELPSENSSEELPSESSSEETSSEPEIPEPPYTKIAPESFNEYAKTISENIKVDRPDLPLQMSINYQEHATLRDTNRNEKSFAFIDATYDLEKVEGHYNVMSGFVKKEAWLWYENGILTTLNRGEEPVQTTCDIEVAREALKAHSIFNTVMFVATYNNGKGLEQFTKEHSFFFYEIDAYQSVVNPTVVRESLLKKYSDSAYNLSYEGFLNNYKILVDDYYMSIKEIDKCQLIINDNWYTKIDIDTSRIQYDEVSNNKLQMTKQIKGDTTFVSTFKKPDSVK